MAKTFYTERDIEDLYAGGQTSLELTDDVVITDMAREKAKQIGFTLIREDDKPSSAPERPYLAKQIHRKKPAQQPKFAPPPVISEYKAPPATFAKPSPTPTAGKQTSIDMNKLEGKIFKAVMDKVDGSVNPNMLAAIIKRVLQNVGGD